jgi:hypothetical protein
MLAGQRKGQRMKNKQLSNWEISIFKWFGVGLICGSLVSFAFAIQKNFSHDRAVGTVTFILKVSRGVKPIVYFEDNAGKYQVTQSSHIISAPYFWSVGDKVPVYFKQGIPSSIYIGGFVHQFLFGTFALCIGLFFKLMASRAYRKA